MVQINWTYQAVLDLREIADNISKDSKKYAKIQIQRLKHRTQILKINPFSGQSIDFFDDLNIRQLTEGRYIIIYKMVDQKKDRHSNNSPYSQGLGQQKYSSLEMTIIPTFFKHDKS